MASDIGTQIVTTKFYSPVDSYAVNDRFLDVRPVGIYEGGYLKIGGTGGGYILTPLVCEIKGVDDSNREYQIKIETTEEIDLNAEGISLTNNNYLVLNWEYTGVASTDFMSLSVTTSPAANDLIVGKLVSGTISYSDRTTPDVQSLFLKVIQDPTATDSSYVWIRAGRAYSTAQGSIKVPEQRIDLSLFAGTTAYVYLTDAGGVAAIGGSPTTAIASYGGRPLLAIVAVPADGFVLTSHITDARNILSNPAVPDDLTLQRSSTTGKLSVPIDNVTIQRNTSTNLVQVIVDNNTIKIRDASTGLQMAAIETRSSDPSGADLYNGRIWLRS